MTDTLNEIKKNLSVFYSNDDYKFDSTVPYTFTDIVVPRETEKTIYLKIVTHRPGIVIGKGGRDLKRLQEFLTSAMEKSVCINLQESEMWKIKY